MTSLRWKDIGLGLLLLCSGVASIAGAANLRNVPFWLVLTFGLNCFVFAIGYGRNLFRAPQWRSFRSFQSFALLVTSIMCVVLVGEVFLLLAERGVFKPGQPEKDTQIVAPQLSHSPLSPKTALPLTEEAIQVLSQRRGVFTLPKEWERRKVEVPGAKSAYTWHGVLHVMDEHGFRRTTPFPPKKPGIFRMMVVGDSLTYGEGIGEQFTYPSLLQKVLEQEFRIEVVNLGVKEFQSTDILGVVNRFFPQLHPDLVIYGVCLNDFLPSGGREYVKGAKFPLPHKVKKFMIKRTRFGRFIDKAYDSAMRAVGLRLDFFDDILQDFEGYQVRFGKDVLAMNHLVVQHSIPPIVSMVLDQYPEFQGRGYRIAKVAERLLYEAGMDVIETEDYYRQYDKRNFGVSPWEGHPNEEANAIFASMMISTLRTHEALQPYRK